MNSALLILFLALPAAQEPPLLRGAYRGPFDEVLVEAAVTEARHGDVDRLDTWERWEFWFEFEQTALFPRVPLPASAWDPAGAGHGAAIWHLRRESALEKGLPVLEEALRSGWPEVREAAALSLGRIGAPASVPALQAALQDPSAPVRQAALLGLGLIGDSPALVAIANRFYDDQAFVGDRALAAVALGLSGRPEAGEILDKYLQRELRPVGLAGPEEAVVQGAVWGAGSLGFEGLLPPLVTGYERLERAGTLSSRRVRSLILQALGRRGEPDAFPLLRRALRDDDFALQRAAAQALGLLGDARALEPLAELVRSTPDSETLHFSLLAIGRIGGGEAGALLAGLKETAARHRQHLACWFLAAGLSRTAGLRGELERGFLSRIPSSPTSRPFQRRDEERLRAAQAIAMGIQGDPRFAKPLRIVLSEPGTAADLAGYCAIALGRIGTAGARKALLEEARAGGGETESRRGLALGLGLSGGPEAALLLARTVLDSRSPEVRWAAAHALGRVRSQNAFDQILAALLREGEVQRSPAHTAHLVLALGFLADSRQEDALAALLTGLNYRQEFPLLRTLASY